MKSELDIALELAHQDYEKRKQMIVTNLEYILNDCVNCQANREKLMYVIRDTIDFLTKEKEI